MSDVAVLVPLRIDGCPYRQAAWQYVQRWWEREHPDWPLVTGTCDEGPWSKGAAIADALAKTTEPIVIVADADVWCDDIKLAVDRIGTGVRAWVIPHRRVHRLDPDATTAVIAGSEAGGPLTQPPYVGIAGGGMTVLTRELLEAAPVDPRFVGWGQEDSAAAIAWTALGGRPWRGTADLWHLYHPPQRRRSRSEGSEESMVLLQRYRLARGSRRLLTLLLSEIGAGACDANVSLLGRARPVSITFVSTRYSDYHIPTIGVRFRPHTLPDGSTIGVAEVSRRGAVAYLQSPWMRRRGIRRAEEVDFAPLDQQQDATVNGLDAVSPEPQGPVLVTEPAPSSPPELPSAPADDVPDGTAAVVLAWVGDDPDRARLAAAAEDRRDRPRTSLITKLNKIAG